MFLGKHQLPSFLYRMASRNNSKGLEETGHGSCCDRKPLKKIYIVINVFWKVWHHTLYCLFQNSRCQKKKNAHSLAMIHSGSFLASWQIENVKLYLQEYKFMILIRQEQKLSFLVQMCMRIYQNNYIKTHIGPLLPYILPNTNFCPSLGIFIRV